ncbi:MAG: diguanylate cyclase [Deltaproteobacteria bacterium]|nr:diguanylate cyclase [Deltaproteobacteria bacterium]
MIFTQIFDMVDMGLVVLDADLKVTHWNRWMELRSEIPADKIVGAPLFDFFPNLNNPKFIRSCRSVLNFGNFSFFSQKLHLYLFPFNPVSSFKSKSQHMQQYCTMGPLRDENNAIKNLYISVQDVSELVLYEQKLIEMNMKDGLTGAYNRRFLDVKLKEEFNRHRRYSRPLSLIMFDIDHFKKVNDTHGHQCGDHILKAVASKIASSIRNTDFLVRYGGEEFCCVLPETAFEAAALLAERFRANVADTEFAFKESTLRITISLGVSGLDKDNNTPELLIKKADESLYEAKKTGRNKVVAHGISA